MEFGKGASHPRYYGTFPRGLAKYVREEAILPLEEAVRKMTSSPDNRIGLVDHGLTIFISHYSRRADDGLLEALQAILEESFVNRLRGDAGISGDQVVEKRLGRRIGGKIFRISG